MAPFNWDGIKRAGAIMRSEVDGEWRYAVVKGQKTGKWSFPKGKVEPGESIVKAAHREIYEETGITKLPKCRGRKRYDYITYFLFDFDVPVPMMPRDGDEVVETKWATIEELKQLPLNHTLKLFVTRG